MRVIVILLVLSAGLLPAQTRQKGAGGFGQRMDANGDGRISREEFPGPKNFFDQFDTDKNGFLTPPEIEAMRRARMQQGARRPGGGASQELFRILDADADRKVSAKEWTTLLKAADFKKADSQADGHVTPEEWMRYFGQAQRPARGGGGGGTQVGALAPKVSAKFSAGDRVLDFSKIKRHTVVVFGSYT
jgi:Ca2+-binding EF-hand superfamily protein